MIVITVGSQIPMASVGIFPFVIAPLVNPVKTFARRILEALLCTLGGGQMVERPSWQIIFHIVTGYLDELAQRVF